MKYVIYLRVSTDEQDNRTQEDKCLDFLRKFDKSDFKYEIYCDKITSKKPLAQRPGIQEALKALSKGDVLVSTRVDRLSRNLYESTCIVQQLDQKKADIILIDQPGIKNKMLFGLFAGMAEEEGNLIRKRIKDKLDVKKKRFERISGEIPYGYYLDEDNPIWIKRKDQKAVLKPGILLEDEEEQRVLLQMYQFFDEGKSYRHIAKLLNDQGYKNRVGNPFRHMSIYRILCRTGRTRSEDQLQEEISHELFH